MHELLITVALGVLAIPVLFLLWRKLRQRSARRLATLLDELPEELGRIESELAPYARNNLYLPERRRRPQATALDQVFKVRLERIRRLAKRVGDEAQRSQAGSLQKLAQNLTETLEEHNARYVKREIRENASLLLDRIGLDETQCLAVVRDDVANLVIGGAGSGKTRVLTGRVRYLAHRGVTPENILAVTFTNKARDEMRERLENAGIPVEGEGDRGVTISTLHALGKRVVEATRAGPISVADDRWANSLVARALRDGRKGRDRELARLYVNALANFHRNEDEQAPELEADKTYRTLRGEHVRSVGERIVADFLLTHNVPYQYEARAAWAKVGEGRDAYHPDFQLPGIDAHIEYWGVDRQGNVAPWMTTSSKEYRQGMEWKRRQFRRGGKTLIECYDYERREGTLEAHLKERLAKAGMELRPMTLEQLERTFKEMKYVGSVIESLLGAFLTNARSLRLSPEKIRQRLRRETPRVKHFGRLGAAILDRYESRLREGGRIDFADMLYQAADAINEGKSPLPKFEHVLVDEFQDTSPAMAHFLKALIQRNESHLFAVGDDWQAIYGFAGGDIDYIVNFEEHFGPATATMVSTNYRSPALVVEAGAALIAKNSKQVPKDVIIASQEKGEAWVHEVPDDDDALVSHTQRLVRDELRSHDPRTILVLSRTAHLLESVEVACRNGNIPVSDPQREEDGGVRILTAHKSKGLEGDVVIVLNASDHLFGFPSKVENPDVLEPVRMSAGNDEAEERRLFYVVLTRAMKRLHLVSRQGLPSPYIAEIEGRAKRGITKAPTSVRVGARFGGTFTVERLFPVSERQASARIRQVGEFTTADGRMRFTSWLPFNLESGGTYSVSGILKDTPYRDVERVKLDRTTRAKLITRTASDIPSDRPRPLRPNPPAAHRPQTIERAT